MGKSIKIAFTDSPKLSPLPDYGDHMMLEEYRQCVECGGFIDYDGFGELATSDRVADVYTCPSELDRTTFPDWCTHIVWYNK